MTWTFTVPEIFIRRARSGYVGATLVWTFRPSSSRVLSCCARILGAKPGAMTAIDNRPRTNTRRQLRKDTVSFSIAHLFRWLFLLPRKFPLKPKVGSTHYFGDFRKLLRDRSLGDGW